MILNRNKITFYTVSELKPNTGIYFKMTGLVDAALSLGYEAELKCVRCVKIKDFISFYKNFVRSDSKFIFLRDIHSWQMMLSYPFLIVSRLQGKVLINDIPTPGQAQLLEMSNNEDRSKLILIISKLLLLLKGPVPYWFFNKLIQYGNEGAFFSFGNKRKTIMLGNGIEKDRIKLRKKEYLSHSGQLHLLGVANLQVSHGYDRIVKAVAAWNSTSQQKVFFHLVSGNAAPPILRMIQSLVSQYHIEEYIIFEPSMDTNQLYDMYGKCDLAVGGVAGYKVGLTMSSALKLREYCLAGMPFMFSTIDADFPEGLPFCFQVSNDDSIDDILKVFEEFPDKRLQFSDESIRQYAIDNLNYRIKLQRLGF